MGNKPRASLWKYKSAAIFFALLSCYLIACGIVCAVRVAQSPNSGLYGKMILSVISTYGLWVAASILAFDPAHLVTSGLPYLLLSPSYIIILNTLVDIVVPTHQCSNPWILV
jgi:chitin synthase